MLLKKVTIHKYKSFLTEQSYTVEDHITRIVGKMNPENCIARSVGKVKLF